MTEEQEQAAIVRGMAAGAAMGAVPVGQLSFIPRAPEPAFLSCLLEVRLDGKPQRSRHEPMFVARGERKVINGEKWVRLSGISASTRPDPAWDTWRTEMVADLRTLGLPCIELPVFADVRAMFPRPQSPRKTYTLNKVTRPYPYPWHSGRVVYVGKPDDDQVRKAAIDVCVQAGLLLDDVLVVGPAGSGRWYAAEGEDPCVEVRLWRA